MKLEDLFEHTAQEVKKCIDPKTVDILLINQHSAVLALHAKALAAHCECLGMNAENSWRVCQNIPIRYVDGDYTIVMLKWGLINDKGEPQI
jgi:hypothetical protein